MSSTEECVRVVSELGFTKLEAEVYVHLLQHSPATGYGVAKAIGRSFPITYKALASLEARGAVQVDDGDRRLASAIPVEELLRHMERSFRERSERVAAAVEDLPRVTLDSRIYQLTTVEQVYERCRAMLDDCRERALIEVDPEPLEILRDTIEATAARGVDVTVRLYKPESIEGVREIHSRFERDSWRAGGAQWLALHVDGQKVLLGYLMGGGRGVHQAVWSASPLLAPALYQYVNSDFHHYSFAALLESATSLEELRAAYAELVEAFPVGRDLGTRELFRALTPERTEAQAQ